MILTWSVKGAVHLHLVFYGVEQFGQLLQPHWYRLTIVSSQLQKNSNNTRWCLTALSCVFNPAPDKDHPLVSACAQSPGRAVGPGLCGRPPEPVGCEKSRCLPAKFTAWLIWLWAICWFGKKSLYLFRFLQIAMISFLNARRLGWPLWTCSISEQTEVRKYSWMAAWCSSGILKDVAWHKMEVKFKETTRGEIVLFVSVPWQVHVLQSRQVGVL